MDLPETYEFDAAVETYNGMTVVFLPRALGDELPFDRFPRLRVHAEIAELPLDAALQPAGDGERFLIVSKRVLKAAGRRLGQPLSVRFWLVDQERVDVPDPLRAALSADARAAKLWEQLTPGKKRTFIARITSAKRPATIDRRVAETVAALRDGYDRPPGYRNRKRVRPPA